MSSILNSENFGQKIYDKFPLKYREDDIGQDFALKRYLQSLSDGGFKHSIDEINGITTLIDPEKADAKVLPILFKQYGLDIFNGIPENYLRYLLPRLGEAWSKKGSTSVVEFITSSLSGIKTTTEVEYDDKENPIVNVRLEMDYNIGDYFPDAEQFIRLLQNFVPFYSDVRLLYSYLFYESEVLGSKDELLDKVILSVDEENVSLYRRGPYLGDANSTSVLGHAIFGISPFGKSYEEADSFSDNIIDKKPETIVLNNPVDSYTNRLDSTLSGGLYTNAMYHYDVIKVGGKSSIVY